MSTGTRFVEMLWGLWGIRHVSWPWTPGPPRRERRGNREGPSLPVGAASTSTFTDSGLKGAEGLFLSQVSCDPSLGLAGLAVIRTSVLRVVLEPL